MAPLDSTPEPASAMTTPGPDWERLRAAFDRLVELAPVDQARELAQLAAIEPDLSAELGPLLQAHQAADGVLDHPPDLPADLAGPDLEAGARIGPYRVTREIGRGGMGTVYEAFRDDEVFTKRVAIKVVPAGFDTEAVARRFARERRILARLDHKNIAALLDGGQAEDGRPFFAMEYVEGERIDRYCARLQLGLRDRLQMMRQVCAAVHYAHQNLVVHRDLKPSNVMVARDGTVKLLDFGIATLLEAAGDLTDPGTAPLTTGYASPEQLRGDPVSTTSDVYSLGILLYELVAGAPPVNVQGLPLLEARQRALDTAPRPPSEAARAVTGTLAWPRGIAGELDQIVMMAIRKEPGRRYQSAEQLSEDLRRLLAGLPVSAQPDSLGYRVRKFAARNRAMVAAVAVAFLALGIGMAVTWWQFRQSRTEQRKTAAVAGFLEDVLAASAIRAGAEGGRTARSTVGEALQAAADRLADGNDLSLDPVVRSSLHQIIGTNYVVLGEYEAGERHLHAALAEQERRLRPEDPAMLKTRLALAKLQLNRGDYPTARRFYEANLGALRAEVTRGHLPSRLLFEALNDFALLQRAQGNGQEAEALFREALALTASLDSATAPGLTGHIESMLALVLLDRGNFAEAERRATDLVARAATRPASGAELCTYLTLLGSALLERGELSAAKASLERGRDHCQRTFAPSYLPIYDNLRLQAQADFLAGDFAEAEKRIDQTLAAYRRHAGPQYINYATALTTKALVLNATGRAREAEPLLRDALAQRESTLPPDHFMTALTRGALGEVLTTQGRFAEAEAPLRESLEALQGSQVGENRRIALAKARLATLYTAWGKPGQAEAYRAGSSPAPN